MRFEFDEGGGRPPQGAALIVLNLGFGSLFDLNVLLAGWISARLGLRVEDPAVMLTHRVAWSLGVGSLLEPAGFRPAGREVALEALAAGLPVFVLPGGDLDAAKPWTRRNRVSFHGRSGFVRIAQESGAPIVPIVITGAGDTLFNFSEGARLARALGLEQRVRQKTLPLSFALPWGLNAGLAGLGYLPVPAKMRGTICKHVRVGRGAEPAAVASAIEYEMDAAARALTAGRNPYADWLTRPARFVERRVDA
jgi:Diacylglycerol acyltransferase